MMTVAGRRRRYLFLVALMMLSFAASIRPTMAQVDRGTGLNFVDESQYRSIPLASTPLLGNLPDEIDLSGSFPIPGNQGAQSSCVGWATSHLKAYQEKVERNWSLASRDHQFSPAYIYNQIKGPAQSCQGGSSFIDALNVLRNGHATLTDFPYDERSCSDIPSAVVKQSARPYAIADWRRVNVQDVTEVKTQVASNFPVLIGMMVDQRFSQLAGEQIYSGSPGPSRGGHALVVVGYSDSKNAFKVINSWGTTWGYNGFGWIDYSTFRQTVREAYVTQDIVVNHPGPTPTPSPTPGPTPQPAPPPSPPQALSVSLNTPMVLHNVPISTPTGMAQGMQIKIPGLITGAANRSLQIVVKFNYLNGPPLRANPLEPGYRDTGGLVATGTPPIPVATNSEATDPLQIFIPYYALNFPPTGGAAVQNLSLTAIALVDNVQSTQTPPVPFTLRW